MAALPTEQQQQQHLAFYRIFDVLFRHQTDTTAPRAQKSTVNRSH
jgi:hypothetical protein